MTSQVLWTGVNLKYDATDQGAFVFALQSAWRASTQHSMFTSFKTSNQAKNSPSVLCRNASFNSAVVPFVRSSSKRVFLQHFAFKRIAQQKEAQLKKPQRMANDEKSISRYYWSKNYFLFFFKTTFSLKKGSELNIKNIFFIVFKCDRWNEAQCQCMFFIFHIEGEVKKLRRISTTRRTKNLLRWKSNKKYSRWMYIICTYLHKLGPISLRTHVSDGSARQRARYPLIRSPTHLLTIAHTHTRSHSHTRSEWQVESNVACLP